MNPPGQHHPDGAFDDPLQDWWQKNGRSLIMGALIVVIGTALVFAFRAYRDSQEEALQIAYNDAVAAEALPAFAEENAGHPLGGVAALQAANEAFAEDDWDRALTFYSVATDSLGPNPLAGKARLGVAISQSKLGNNEAAKSVLSALAGDDTEFPAARAEALYFLSLLSLEAGDADAFSRYSTDLAEIDQMGRWSARLTYFEESVPLPVATPEPPAIESSESAQPESPGTENAAETESIGEDPADSSGE